MKLGIKVGPTDWPEKLSKASFEAVEVHFKPQNLSQYLPLFESLKKGRVLTGLHFWGTLRNGYFPNFATKDARILQESLFLLEKTIDIANHWGFNYVLTHPFSCDLWKLDENEIFSVEESSIAWEEGLEVMKNSLQKINQYAQKKRIVFVVEQSVKKEPISWGENNNSNSFLVRAPSPKELKQFGINNIKLALDFAHIATWFGPADRKIIIGQLKQTLLDLREYAHVIHLGSIKQPFITDTGNGFTPKEDAINVLPTSQETIELLSLFEKTDNFVIPEPQKGDHLWHNLFLNNSGLFNHS